MYIVSLSPTIFADVLITRFLWASYSFIIALLLLFWCGEFLSIRLCCAQLFSVTHLAVVCMFTNINPYLNTLVRPDSLATLAMQNKLPILLFTSNTRSEPIQAEITFLTMARDKLFLTHPTCPFRFSVPLLFDRIIVKNHSNLNLEVLKA